MFAPDDRTARPGKRSGRQRHVPLAVVTTMLPFGWSSTFTLSNCDRPCTAPSRWFSSRSGGALGHRPAAPRSWWTARRSSRERAVHRADLRRRCLFSAVWRLRGVGAAQRVDALGQRAGGGDHRALLEWVDGSVPARRRTDSAGRRAGCQGRVPATGRPADRVRSLAARACVVCRPPTVAVLLQRRGLQRKIYAAHYSRPGQHAHADTAGGQAFAVQAFRRIARRCAGVRRALCDTSESCALTFASPPVAIRGVRLRGSWRPVMPGAVNMAYWIMLIVVCSSWSAVVTTLAFAP